MGKYDLMIPYEVGRESDKKIILYRLRQLGYQWEDGDQDWDSWETNKYLYISQAWGLLRGESALFTCSYVTSIDYFIEGLAFSELLQKLLGILGFQYSYQYSYKEVGISARDVCLEAESMKIMIDTKNKEYNILIRPKSWFADKYNIQEFIDEYNYLLDLEDWAESNQKLKEIFEFHLIDCSNNFIRELNDPSF